MHKSATEPNDLEKFFVERFNASDIEGLLALYEPDAIIASGDTELAAGSSQLRAFFTRYLEQRVQLGPSEQAQAVHCGNLALTSSRLDNGDTTAEVARRQTDGSWRWVIDQFKLVNS